MSMVTSRALVVLFDIRSWFFVISRAFYQHQMSGCMQNFVFFVQVFICIFSDLDSVLMQKFSAAFGQANDTAIVLCSVLLVPISLFFPLVPFCCDSLLIYKTCYDDNVSEIKLQSYVTINKKTLSTLTNKCNN